MKEGRQVSRRGAKEAELGTHMGYSLAEPGARAWKQRAMQRGFVRLGQGLGQGEPRAAAQAAAGISAVVPAGLKASVAAVCCLTWKAMERRNLSSCQEER